MENPKVLALRQSYGRSLAEKLDQIRGYWTRCEQGGWAGEAGSTLRTLVHRLAGSSGSYGFDVLCQAAQSLNQALTELGRDEGEVAFPDPRCRARYVTFCRVMEEEVRRFSAAS